MPDLIANRERVDQAMANAVMQQAIAWTNAEKYPWNHITILSIICD